MQFTDPLAEKTLKLIEEAPRHIRDRAREGHVEDALMVLDAVIQQARLLRQCIRNVHEAKRA